MTKKKQEGGFLVPSLVPSSFIKGIFGKGVTRAGRGAMRAGRQYNNMNHMDKIFTTSSSFKQYQDY